MNPIRIAPTRMLAGKLGSKTMVERKFEKEQMTFLPLVLELYISELDKSIFSDANVFNYNHCSLLFSLV